MVLELYINDKIELTEKIDNLKSVNILYHDHIILIICLYDDEHLDEEEIQRHEFDEDEVRFCCEIATKQLITHY